MDKLKIHTVWEYEFRRGTIAEEAVGNVNMLFEKGSNNKVTVSRWFTKFSKENFDLTNELRGKRELKVNNHDLRAAVETDASQTTEL